MINHAWRYRRGMSKRAGESSSVVARVAGWAVTFLAVVVAWVFFRAPTFEAAGRMLGSMFLMNGVDLGSAVSRLGAAWWTATLLLVVTLMPNSQQIMRMVRPVLDARRHDLERGILPPFRFIRWFPSTRWALVIAAMLILALLNLGRPTEFIYFQF
jgi:hypothetical protein